MIKKISVIFAAAAVIICCSCSAINDIDEAIAENNGDTEILQTNESENGLNEEYEKIIEKYKTAEENDFYADDSQKLTEEDLNTEILSLSKSGSEFYYSLYDINNDDTPELIIGIISEAVNSFSGVDYIIYDMYGLEDGSAKRLFDTYSMGYRRQYVIKENNIIMCYGSGSASAEYISFYNLPAGSTEPRSLKEFYIDCSDKTFKYYENETEISQSKYDSYMKAHNNADIDWVYIEHEMDKTFERSSSTTNDVYSIYKNGYNIYQNDSGLYVNGTFIDSDIYWNFISDGRTLYYISNISEGNVYRLDLATLGMEYLFSCPDIFLRGCYNNEYLYYTSNKYNGSIKFDLIIYDLNGRKEINCVNDVGSVYIGDNYIFTEPNTGQVVPLSITQMDFRGENSKVIITDAAAKTGAAIGNKFYYASMTDGVDYDTQIMSYDADTGEIEALTDIYHNAYAQKITASYAVFKPNAGASADTFTVEYDK